MSITVIKQNLIHAKEDIIGHQVNGLEIMGGGVAKDIRAAFPLVYNRYAEYVKAHPSPESILGKNLMISQNDTPVHQLNPKSGIKIVANLFGQARIGRDKKHTDDAAIKKAMIDLAEFAKIKGFTVALPYGIGCGLGGGDWSETYAMIENVFSDQHVTLYQYKGGPYPQNR